MFDNTASECSKVSIRNLIDPVVNAGLIALAGGAIAAALAIGTPLHAGGPSAAAPTLECHMPLDPRIVHAPCPAPHLLRLAGPVPQPIGLGWG